MVSRQSLFSVREVVAVEEPGRQDLLGQLDPLVEIQVRPEIPALQALLEPQVLQDREILGIQVRPEQLDQLDLLGLLGLAIQVRQELLEELVLPEQRVLQEQQVRLDQEILVLQEELEQLGQLVLRALLGQPAPAILERLVLQVLLETQELLEQLAAQAQPEALDLQDRPGRVRPSRSSFLSEMGRIRSARAQSLPRWSVLHEQERSQAGRSFPVMPHRLLPAASRSTSGKSPMRAILRPYRTRLLLRRNRPSQAQLRIHRAPSLAGRHRSAPATRFSSM